MMAAPDDDDDDDKPSLTTFQQQVYDVVTTIPKGSVRTYGSIAKELGTSARAVGTAMGRNPYGPCDTVP
jgi:methylated-DNA-[protein]-cysteine S-methyltransferase